MLLFHEPSFRRRCDAIADTGQASPEDFPFLVFLTSLLAVGAQYVNPSDRPQELAATDLEALQRKMLLCARSHLLDILEQGTIEGLQTCVLLSTFYLYHDRPNLGFIVHGMGVKCAHSMCLHQEPTWREYTPIMCEVRRRVWWALYVIDWSALALSS